jgi:hypothetical protein
MKEKDEIKDLFKGSFDNFEVTPPASVKINVDQKIIQIQSIRKMKWFLFGGISVLVLVITQARCIFLIALIGCVSTRLTRKA